jgi:glycosyltransferase involved in cell wall biosynthesis
MKKKKKKKILSLLWGPFGFRSSELAEAIGCEQISITLLYGPRYYAPLRYLVLFFKTLLLLSSRRPDIVYAQNPPVFCPLTCLLYCKLSGARLIVDHHSVWRVKTLGRGAISRAIGLLEATVARSAYANTVPHGVWGKELARMGGRHIEVIYDFVPANGYERSESLRRRFAEQPTIAVSSHGGHPLERIEVEALSVAKLEETVALLITGPPEKLERRLSSMPLPDNVHYLGFLQRETYEQLKASADLALNITDEPYTLSHVLFEYAASSLPIISSKQKVVEEVFGDSILYVESSVPDTADNVRMLTGDREKLRDYREKIRAKFGELQKKREEELVRFRKLFT